MKLSGALVSMDDAPVAGRRPGASGEDRLLADLFEFASLRTGAVPPQGLQDTVVASLQSFFLGGSGAAEPEHSNVTASPGMASAQPLITDEHVGRALDAYLEVAPRLCYEQGTAPATLSVVRVPLQEAVGLDRFRLALLIEKADPNRVVVERTDTLEGTVTHAAAFDVERTLVGALDAVPFPSF